VTLINRTDRFKFAEWLDGYLDGLGKPAAALYGFDEIAGTTCVDLTGNGHDGTYSGAELAVNALTDDSGFGADLSGGSMTIPYDSTLTPGDGDYTIIALWQWDGSVDAAQVILDNNGIGGRVIFQQNNGLFRARYSWPGATLADTRALIEPASPGLVMHAGVLDATADTITCQLNDKVETLSPSEAIGTVDPDDPFTVGAATLETLAFVPYALTEAELRRIWAVAENEGNRRDNHYTIWDAQRTRKKSFEDIFVIAGQSNAVGIADHRQFYAGLPSSQVYHHFDSAWGEWDANANPTDHTKESQWPVVATYIAARQSRSSGWVATAEGGTSITEWQKGATEGWYSRMVSTVADAVTAQSRTPTLNAMIWYQGEADIQAGMTQGTYESNLNALVDDVAADLGIPTMVGRVHNWDAVSDAAHQTIVDAQNAVIASNANAVAGPDQSGVELPQIHYETDAEIVQFAEEIYRSIATEYY